LLALQAFRFILIYLNLLKSSRKKYCFDVYPLKNNLFGETVTVTGLLTGEDIIKGLVSYVETGDVLLIPDVTMKDSENMFIDSLKMQDVEKVLQIKTIKIGSEPEDIIKAIEYNK